MRRVTQKPNVIAGLKCPPEMCPTAETITAIASPWASATPVMRSRVLLRTGAFSLSARAVLGGIVALSAVVRGFAALAHVTPYYFPDEYLYSALARGIAQGHGPVVRGTFVHFPALLQPLLT